MNKLLRAVEDYLDDEREYVRFAEREIQVLEKKARDERRQTQRRMIAALYWRAGEASLLADEEHARWESAASPIDRDAACRAADRACDVLEGFQMVAEATEAACPR